ncbi:MAG: hypothetical protein JWR50_81 [Mucilaginibacter sp.]|nr:hypothetical protein [Mucilaginibacter sp.]
MNRRDRIKLVFTRNWKFPGKERLSSYLLKSYKKNASGKSNIAWLTNEDIAIFADPNSFIEWQVASMGAYEDEINKLIRVSLKDGDTAIDVGGNIGLQSIRMSQAVGKGGRVYSFEPLNYLQEKFKKNVALNRVDNITIFPLALSDTESTAEFTIDPNGDNQGTFSLADTGPGAEKQSVDIKIADLMPELAALQTLHLVKIDVEGFEFQVLRGMKGLLQKHKPRIIFEYDTPLWARTGQDIKACYQFLGNMGYSFYQVTEIGCEYITSAREVESGNVFCIQG